MAGELFREHTDRSCTDVVVGPAVVLLYGPMTRGGVPRRPERGDQASAGPPARWLRARESIGGLWGRRRAIPARRVVPSRLSMIVPPARATRLGILRP